MWLEKEQERDLTTFYFPSSHLDDVVNLLGVKFRVNSVTGDIYEVSNILEDPFGRVIRESNVNSKLQLLNFPYSELVETDIMRIEKMLMKYQRSEKLKRLWRAGIEEFRKNNIRTYPHVFHFLYYLIKEAIKYTKRKT